MPTRENSTFGERGVLINGKTQSNRIFARFPGVYQSWQRGRFGRCGVVGGAFGQIVDAAVKLVTGAILDPTLNRLGVDRITEWPAGELLVAIINFLVIAFVVYLIVRALERFKRKQVEEEAPLDPQQQLADAANRLAAALESRQL